MEKYRPKVMITFSEGGENGGPYTSHKRIMESDLINKYKFIPIVVPRTRKLLFSFTGMKKFVKKIRDISPDIIHIEGLQLIGFCSMLACKLAGIKHTVVAVHGSSLKAIQISKFEKMVYRKIEEYTLKNATAIYGVSQYVIQWDNIKKYQTKCFGYIYNMAPSINIKNDNYRLREELSIKKNEIIITSTARIVSEKGFPVLCEAIKKLKEKNGIKFLIVGNGSYLVQMKQEVIESGLEDKVIFLGYRKDVMRILQDTDIFVMPSLHETLCISLIEAGLMGIASVASNVGGIPEVIIDNYNGFLVPPGDCDAIVEALTKLIDNSELRSIMGNNAKQIIDERFSYKIITDKIDSMYRSVLEDGS